MMPNGSFTPCKGDQRLCSDLQLRCCSVLQVLLLDELTTFLDGEDQKGVLEAVRKCVGGSDQASHPLRSLCTTQLTQNSYHRPLSVMH